MLSSLQLGWNKYFLFSQVSFYSCLKFFHQIFRQISLLKPLDFFCFPKFVQKHDEKLITFPIQLKSIFVFLPTLLIQALTSSAFSSLKNALHISATLHKTTLYTNQFYHSKHSTNCKNLCSCSFSSINLQHVAHSPAEPNTKHFDILHRYHPH